MLKQLFVFLLAQCDKLTDGFRNIDLNLVVYRRVRNLSDVWEISEERVSRSAASHVPSVACVRVTKIVRLI